MASAAEGALSEFRRTRRRRFVAELDLMEVLYRVYVFAIFAAIGLGVLGGAVDEAPVDPGSLDAVRVQAPAIVGIAVALAVLAGLRSGARGGPLAIEAAEVQYTLLAPVPRAKALRPGAARQLRVATVCGGVLGAVVGNFVFRRFPGSAVEWIASLALFGALVPAAVLGAALLASGRRLRPLLAGGLGTALVLWSVADLALGATTSPGTMLGELTTLPLQHGARIALAGAGALLTLALLAGGLAAVGGVLLEAAQRRARLTAELRFSASVRDVRSVILLRRQLASERPRRRPWLRVGSSGAHPCWRRDWQSFMRWPLVRVVRILVLAAAAGGAAAAAWHLSVFLAVIPGALLFLAALDAIEPLAQEADHPTLVEGFPVAPRQLIRRHLAGPAVALAALVLVAGLAASAVAASSIGIELGALMALPSGYLLAAAAAVSATNDPYGYISAPALTYAEQGAPILAALIAIGVPVLIARGTWLGGGSPLLGVVPVELFVAGAAATVSSLLGERMAKRQAVKA